MEGSTSASPERSKLRQQDGIIAVIATYRRRALLMECLEGLAKQTMPLTGVIVVDNDPDGGTLNDMRQSELPSRIPIFYLANTHNGGSEAFCLGFRAAVAMDAEWIWLMDDDAEPKPDALGSLISSEAARRPNTILLAPAVETLAGEKQLSHRGTLRRGGLGFPWRPLQPKQYDTEHRLGYASYVGPLVRSSKATRAPGPPHDYFIWVDDVAFTERLSRHGELWLVPEAVIVHKEAEDISTRNLLQRYRHLYRLADFWRCCYGMRNMLRWGRESGYLSNLNIALLLAAYFVAAIPFASFPLRWRLLYLFAEQGLRDTPASVTPAQWRDLLKARNPRAHLTANALRFDSESGMRVERVAGAGSVAARG